SLAKLSIPRVAIHENGMIASFLERSQECCGVNFSVTSVSLEIDDDFFDRMQIKEEHDSIVVELWAGATLEMNDEYLIRFADLMCSGVENFVFERSSDENTNG